MGMFYFRGRGCFMVAKFILWLQDGQLKALKIQLIGEEDPSVDEDDGGMGRWREYVASYVTRHPTEWMSTLDGKKMSGGEPFLSRYVVVAALYVWSGGNSECYY